MSEESLRYIDESSVGPALVIDMDASYSEYADDVKPEVKPQIWSLHPQAPESMVGDQKKKPEERPVKHRKTGKISIGNFARRRRLLSVWADSANEYLQQLRINEQQNRPSPVLRTLPAPSRRPQTAVTTSIIVPSSFNNSIPPLPALVHDDSDGDASSAANSSRASSPQQDQNQPQQSHPPQQQQQPQQSPQMQELIRLIHTETFCVVCQMQYASRKSIKQHEKSQKHKDNVQNMPLPRKQLLEQAAALARANRANS